MRRNLVLGSTSEFDIFTDMTHDLVMTIVDELYALCCTQLRLLISSSEEIKDAHVANKRRNRKLAAKRRAEQTTCVKKLFIHAGS